MTLQPVLAQTQTYCPLHAHKTKTQCAWSCALNTQNQPYFSGYGEGNPFPDTFPGQHIEPHLRLRSISKKTHMRKLRTTNHTTFLCSNSKPQIAFVIITLIPLTSSSEFRELYVAFPPTRFIHTTTLWVRPETEVKIQWYFANRRFQFKYPEFPHTYIWRQQMMRKTFLCLRPWTAAGSQSRQHWDRLTNSLSLYNKAAYYVRPRVCGL